MIRKRGEDSRRFLRQLAHSTAKEQAIAELNELGVDEGAGEEEEQAADGDVGKMIKAKRKGQLLRKLALLCPGMGGSVGAIRNKTGEVVTDPGEMAEAQKEHWEDIFQERLVDLKKVKKWLSEEKSCQHNMHDKILGGKDDKWKVRPRHIKRAIDMTGQSAPGPDGIPFKAYRNLGLLSQNVLWRALEDLSNPGAEDRLKKYMTGPGGHCTFNESLMVFLPKKASGSLNGTDFFDPSDTRPLSIVNTDNRIMASAVRLVIEPILDLAVSDAQQGFLAGRSLIKDVMDVDEAMRTYAMRGRFPAAIFYDFQAAFPSLSQAFLLVTLEHLGLPPHIIQFIRCLYYDNRCWISIGGKRHAGFTIKAGIRQGCPLSPLLFAVVADILLRRLQRLFPHAIRRAYADDLAMVVDELLDEGKPIMDVFDDYQRLSGLRLNMKKVVVIPLWFPEAIRQFHQVIIGPQLNREEKIRRAWYNVMVGGRRRRSRIKRTT